MPWSRSDLRGVEPALALAVALRDAALAALVPGGAGQALDLELHRALQHGLGELLQEVAAAALLHQLQKCHLLVGRRVVSGAVQGSQPDLTPTRAMTTPSSAAANAHAKRKWSG